MSIDLVSKALRQRIGNPIEKLVLIAFAEHAGEDGLAFPSVRLIAAEVECSERTAQRTIRALVDRGLLAVHSFSKGGRGRATRYRVCPEAIGRAPDYDELRKGDIAVSPFCAGKGDKSGVKGDKNAVKGDIAVSPEPITYNQNRRRSRDASAEGASLARRADELRIRRQDPDEHDSAFKRRINQAETDLRIATGHARRLGLDLRGSAEPLETFVRRVDDAVFAESMPQTSEGNP